MESVISDFIKLLFAFPVAWVMRLGEENKEKKTVSNYSYYCASDDLDGSAIVKQ